MSAEYEFDVDACELRFGSEPVDLEPQALRVAGHLIENSHRLISKGELLDKVWGDRFVSESALSTRIKQVRRAFGDNGTDQRVIKTIHGKGYRFVGDINVIRSAVDGPVHNLPSLRTELVGRTSDLEDSIASLHQHRLTTMIGIGGVGKTSLATATGHAVIDRFDAGVWFVDLVPVTGADQLLLAMVKAAGLSLQAGSAIDQISSIIRGREVLFILDNCEHVVDAVAEIVEQLLDSTSGPRFLLTSREPLGLPGEARLLIEPLRFDEDGGPAVDMLAACASRFGFAIESTDHSAAAEVCRRLDGIPLAIELAAAQLRHLTIEDLSARLGDRYDLLVGSRRGERHASLRTVLEATWASVSNTEREVLRQLSQCPGTLSVTDIVELMDQPEGTTLNALARLVDCSLLVRSGSSGRYRVLETVRAFASESADAGPEIRRDRLADWCLDRVGESVTTHAFDFDLAQWCRTHDDALDGAEAHLARTRVDSAAMLIAAQGLAMHLDDGSRAAELSARVDRYLGRIDAPGMRARLHLTGTFSAMAARDPAGMARHGESGVVEARRHGDPSILAISLVLRSWSALHQPDQALELVTEAAEVADTAGDHRAYDMADGYRAWHLALTQRYDEAIEVAGKVLSRSHQQVGDDQVRDDEVGYHEVGYDVACGAAALAACQAIREPGEALRLYTSFIERSEFRSMVANELLLASIHAANGSATATARIVMEVHRRLERAGQHSLPDVLVPVAILALSLGEMDRARKYALAVRQSRRPTQSLQVTCLYQQLRPMVDLEEGDDQDLRSTERIGAEALTWLESLPNP